MVRREEDWEAADRMRRENASVTPAVRAANAADDAVKAAVNAHVAKSLLAGLSKTEACDAAIAAGFRERDADNCPAMSDARDPDMLAWHAERGDKV